MILFFRWNFWKLQVMDLLEINEILGAIGNSALIKLVVLDVSNFVYTGRLLGPYYCHTNYSHLYLPCLRMAKYTNLPCEPYKVICIICINPQNLPYFRYLTAHRNDESVYYTHSIRLPLLTITNLVFFKIKWRMTMLR